jgi:hypothetical protein
MHTPDPYLTSIKQRARTDPALLRLDFEDIESLSVDLLKNEQAYWTVPRQENAWRLPRDTNDSSHSKLLLTLPVRDDNFVYNAHIAVIPQPIVMHRKVAALLEERALRMFEHFPEENTLARREHGVPMLIGRFDVIVDKQGNIQICELDDVCSLWPAMTHINPIVESYLRAFEAQLGMPIYTAELFQYADWPLDVSPRVRKKYCHVWHFEDNGKLVETFIPRSSRFPMATRSAQGISRRWSKHENDRTAAYYEKLLQKYYLHNEDHWRGDINDAWLLKDESLTLNEVALSVRAFRDAKGFQQHIDRYGSRSISMAWHRDSKMPLVEEKLGALAANLDVAVEFARQWQADFPDRLVVFKTLYGARTEGTAIFSSRGTKSRGVSSAAQIRRKFGSAADSPIVVQPYKEPDSLHTAGIQFIGGEEGGVKSDRTIIRSVQHLDGREPGARVVAGQEQHFPLLFRSFVIYLPGEKRLVHAGGLWQATDGKIVHGGAHSVAGPLYVEGLGPHPQIPTSAALKAAETMLSDMTLQTNS